MHTAMTSEPELQASAGRRFASSPLLLLLEVSSGGMARCRT
jgi:hypothetical protein